MSESGGKRPLLARGLSDLRERASPVREIMQLATKKQGEMISLAGGWVNHEAPELLRESYQRLVSDPALFHASGGYSATGGSQACRQAIVNYEAHAFGVTGLGPEQVVIGQSSTQLTHALLQVLLDPGDTVLLLDPSYCNFPAQVQAAGGPNDGRIVEYFGALDAGTFRYVLEERVGEFAAAIRARRPKVVLLVSPDNPTSQVLSDSVIQAAVEAARETGAVVIIDMAYKELVFERPYPRYFAAGPNEHFITIHSNSKWIRGLGRRLGWVEAPEEVVQAIELVQGTTILAPDTLHQLAFADFVERAIAQGAILPYLDATRALYARAAATLVAQIDEHLGVPRLVPQGGLYTCIQTPGPGREFVDRALQAGVIAVPGAGFGPSLQRAARISFGPLVNDLGRLGEAIKRLGQVIHA
jgi:aspartate/methionine/tyrosine aminotransferase